jgi:hypothetical protein
MQHCTVSKGPASIAPAPTTPAPSFPVSVRSELSKIERRFISKKVYEKNKNPHKILTTELPEHC